MEIQNLKFFTYDQNNSGGDFVFDAERGISTKVIMQARHAREADRRAEDIGLYFDGSGDCSCCGDRWYSQRYSGEGFDTPMIYRGLSVVDWIEDEYFSKWMAPDQPELFIHLYDDRFMGFVYGEKNNYRIFESADVLIDFVLEIGS